MSTWVSASLLGTSTDLLPSRIQSLKEAKADSIHWDVMDGCFVPAVSFMDNPMDRLSCDFPFDVHLMVEEPGLWIPTLQKAQGITLHPTSGCHKISFSECCQRVAYAAPRIRLGIAISPEDLWMSWPWLEAADFLLVMTVYPGKGGQSFLESQLSVVKALRQRFPTKSIGVDGGIRPETACLAKQAGADVLISGSYLWSASSLAQAVASLREA